VNSLDYSSYEGADILHDLNQPVPANLKGRFDAVVEGGSLEHIFHFPIAVANLMQMTKVGGTIFASRVSNNLCGHGFYQFSPELIFRVFWVDKGFELGKVLALEARYPGIELNAISKAYEVADPARIGGRVALITKRPMLLLFKARRIADVVPFSNIPMQSDYAEAWVANYRPTISRIPQWIKALPLYSSFRSWLRETAFWNTFDNWLTGHRQLKQYSLKNKLLFKNVE
jgi:hypothetical protein